MPVTVNGVELTDDDIEREMDPHRDARNPAHLATVSAILRRLMRTEAERLGIAGADMNDDALAQALLTHEAPVPDADEAAAAAITTAAPTASAKANGSRSSTSCSRSRRACRWTRCARSHSRRWR